MDRHAIQEAQFLLEAHLRIIRDARVARMGDVSPDRAERVVEVLRAGERQVMSALDNLDEDLTARFG